VELVGLGGDAADAAHGLPALGELAQLRPEVGCAPPTGGSPGLPEITLCLSKLRYRMSGKSGMV